MERCVVDKDSLAGRQGIDPTLLESGTKIKIETYNSTYEIMMVDLDKITIQGGNKKGSVRFPEPVAASIVGSVPHRGIGLPKLNWLGKDRCLVLEMVTGRELHTSPVIEMTVTAPDESWEYCMEWKRQTD